MWEKKLGKYLKKWWEKDIKDKSSYLLVYFPFLQIGEGLFFTHFNHRPAWAIS